MPMRASGIALVAALVAAASPAFADKKPKDKDKGKQHAETAIGVSFSVDAREKIRGYFVETYGRGNCPPGLAKKANGCMPPGQAKKRYVIGKPLPAGVPTGPISAQLSVRIGAPPTGYIYAMVDGDLVKLAVGTMLVVDAIQGLVE
jgi:hypothetical protein